MPGKRYIFGDTLYDLVTKMIRDQVAGYDMGGRLNIGNPPRPFIGQLAQRYVAYDSTEAEHPGLNAILLSGWENSLLDNLNHIRYWQQPARWFEPTFNDTYYVTVKPGIWWRGAGNYTDFEGGQIQVTSPDPSNPRIDVLYLDNSGGVALSAGTPAASPTATYPGNTHLPIAELYIKQSGDADVTTFGVGYIYQSGYAQGYLQQDVRPYFGINYDVDLTGAQYLYELLDVDEAVATPINNDVLSYDQDSGEWKALQWFLGGIGGGQPTYQIDGPIVVLDHVGGAYICTRSGELDSVYIYCETLGTSGETIVDANLNGVSVFSNPANRPSLAYNDANSVQRSAVLSGVAFVEEDVFTVDIDQAAAGAANLTVVLALDVAETHPFSDGPHTGVLRLSDLEDGIVSGYPLLSQGNGLAGGPAYGQMGTIGVQNNAVTYPKLGAGAAKWKDRQGGSASDWTTGGTTNYDLTTSNIVSQAGTMNVSVPGSSGSNPWRHKTKYTVTFPSAFSQPPLVFVQAEIGNKDASNYISITAEVRAVTASNFTFYAVVSDDTDQTFTVFWHAVGAE